MLSKVILFAFTVLSVLVTTIYCETCKEVLLKKKLTVANDVDIKKLSGKWYEVRRNHTSPPAYNADCNRDTITIRNNNKTVADVYQLGSTTSWTAKHNATGILSRANTDGNLTLSYNATGNPSVPYWILLTDHAHYSLVYSCRDNATKQAEEFVTVMGRNKTVSNDNMTHINEHLKRYSQVPVKWITVNQTDKCDRLYSSASRLELLVSISIVSSIALFLSTKVYS